MDKELVRFVGDRSTNIIHDRLCNKANSISERDVILLNELDDNMEVCKSCLRKIIIRNAIKDDENFMWYLSFLDEGPLSTNSMKGSFFKYGVELLKLSETELLIKYKEDKWILKYIRRNRYDLFHNDYKVISNEERIILPTFHRQKEVPLRMKDLIKFIVMYEWKDQYHKTTCEKE